MNDLFDFNQLDELMSADPEELRQVLWDLFTDFGASFSVLPEKVDGRLNEVAMEAHQLRGVSSSFGLKRVSDLGKELESTANHGEKDESLVLIAKIREALRQSETELRKERPEYFE